MVGGEQYFFLVIPSDDPAKPALRALVTIPRGVRFPMQFGRQVMCTMLNKLDRLDWKRCAVGKDGETAQTDAFRKVFEPFEPSTE